MGIMHPGSWYMGLGKTRAMLSGLAAGMQAPCFHASVLTLTRPFFVLSRPVIAGRVRRLLPFSSHFNLPTILLRFPPQAQAEAGDVQLRVGRAVPIGSPSSFLIFFGY
jgi:hypothetical protein